jgi:hypothetical protein
MTAKHRSLSPISQSPGSPLPLVFMELDTNNGGIRRPWFHINSMHVSELP